VNLQEKDTSLVMPQVSVSAGTEKRERLNDEVYSDF